MAFRRGRAGVATAAMVTLAIASAGSSCYTTPDPECAFLCGNNGACPDGYRCAGDGWCKRDDVAETFVCDPTVMPMIDAGVADAMLPDAMLPDAMPPDAMPPDAMPPDAMPPDAMLPDAMPVADSGPADAFVNSPPDLTVPVTSPLNVVAGTRVMFTVTADDPDAPPQVVTLSAQHGGSMNNPFTSGATFDPGTGVFDFTTALLGGFDIIFRATDDFAPPGTDSGVIFINVSANPVVINEVRTTPVATQDIELHNRDTAPVDLTGWQVCITATACHTIPAVAATLAADGYLVVHWDQDGADSATDVFTGTGGALPTLDSEGAIVLYNGAPAATAAMDAVVWSAGGASYSLIDDAVAAAQWPSADAPDRIMGTPAAGETYQYSGTGESATSWTLASPHSLGAANP